MLLQTEKLPSEMIDKKKLLPLCDVEEKNWSWNNVAKANNKVIFRSKADKLN